MSFVLCRPIAAMAAIATTHKYPYVCAVCGESGVKLWRQYNTFACNVDLHCALCALKADKRVKGPVDDRGLLPMPYTNPAHNAKTDQLGNLMPAIALDDFDGYWGYCSAPGDRCRWWRNLPTYPLDYFEDGVLEEE